MLNLCNKKMNNPILKKWTEDLIRQLLKGNMKMANKHIKRWPTHGEMKVNHSETWLPLEQAKPRMRTKPSAGEGVGRWSSTPAGEDTEQEDHCGR